MRTSGIDFADERHCVDYFYPSHRYDRARVVQGAGKKEHRLDLPMALAERAEGAQWPDAGITSPRSQCSLWLKSSPFSQPS